MFCMALVFAGMALKWLGYGVGYCYGKLLARVWYYFCMMLVLFLVLCWYGVGMVLAWFSYSFSLVLVLLRYDSCTFLVFL